jgi:predicted nicotinamide N-methyase
LLSASFGTAKTVLTDKSREVLELLHKNIQINFTNEGDKQRFYCKYLKWGDNLEEFRETDGQFDIIIASDVVYNDLNLTPLASTVATLLSDNPSSTFIVAHVSRYIMDT